MLKKLYSILFAWIFCLNCHAIDLSSEESIILNNFFQIMLEKSEGGFVLLGQKPVCIHGFYLEDYFLKESERHLFSVTLKETVSTWKKLNKDHYFQNIIIHIYDNPDSHVKDTFHVLFINKNLFLKVVQENLSLFQYILGPSVTPSKLLNKLIDPKETFHGVLKGNKVLIGILLGFGTQNSLYVSRTEYIDETLFQEFPPLKSQLSKLGDIKKEYLQILLTRESRPSQKEQLEPSFGYSSLKEEIKDLISQLDISSSKLCKETPPFIFGRLKEDEETKIRIPELEDTQAKIRQLLASDLFLKDVLQLIYPQAKINIDLSIKQLIFNESELKQLPFLVAYNIWNIIKDEDINYLTSFIKGMKDADQGVNNSNLSANTLNYERLKAVAKIKNQLQATDRFFNQLDKDSTYTCIVPFKLYYKTIQESSGIGLGNQQNVLTHYTIKTPNKQILADTWMSGRPVELSLLEVISGFAWGMKEMKKGEIRQVFIHPSLGYGIYTTLDKGIYLEAYIQLMDIDETQKLEKFPELTFLDLQSDINSNTDLEYEEETKKVGYLTGYQIWQHYKKNRAYTFAQILDWLNQFQNTIHVELEKNQHLINRLHWNIYYKD